MNQTPMQVMNALAHMSTAQIVDCMRDNGITGYPGISRQCPITRLVHKITGVEISTGLGTWAIRVSEEVEPGGDLPASVVTFVRRFDDYEYAYLIDPAYFDLEIDLHPAAVPSIHQA